MEKLCAAIGFTKEMIESLLDIFKVEQSPTDSSKLVLTINKQPIGDWFKEQFGKLGHGFRKAPDEPRKGGGFRL